MASASEGIRDTQRKVRFCCLLDVIKKGDLEEMEQGEVVHWC